MGLVLVTRSWAEVKNRKLKRLSNTGRLRGETNEQHRVLNDISGCRDVPKLRGFPCIDNK